MTRSFLGNCPSCNKSIRVNPKKVQPGMEFTCACGWKGIPAGATAAPSPAPEGNLEKIVGVLKEFQAAGSLVSKPIRPDRSQAAEIMHHFKMQPFAKSVASYRDAIMRGEVSDPAECKGRGIGLVLLSDSKYLLQAEREELAALLVKFAFAGYLVVASQRTEGTDLFEKCFRELFECLNRLGATGSGKSQ